MIICEMHCFHLYFIKVWHLLPRLMTHLYVLFQIPSFTAQESEASMPLYSRAMEQVVDELRKPEGASSPPPPHSNAEQRSHQENSYSNVIPYENVQMEARSVSYDQALPSYDEVTQNLLIQTNANLEESVPPKYNRPRLAGQEKQVHAALDNTLMCQELRLECSFVFLFTICDVLIVRNLE